MNTEMAYLVGMVLGNGEIQRGKHTTVVTVDIPYRNLKTDDMKDVAVYVKASTVDIRSMVEPLLGKPIAVTQGCCSTQLTFENGNDNYVLREVVRLVDFGTRHTTMRMHQDVFSFTTDEKRSLMRGVADVTGHIRRSNAYIDGAHRVYIEIPGNWQMVADVANVLMDIDVPVQTIDFGHPNMRDSNLQKYKAGNPNFWKKEHQVKIFANEFLPVGFNIAHKQEALERLAEEMLEDIADPTKTHRFYWEKNPRKTVKPHHPCESDSSLPDGIRGKHFNSWTEIAEVLGYGP